MMNDSFSITPNDESLSHGQFYSLIMPIRHEGGRPAARHYHNGVVNLFHRLKPVATIPCMPDGMNGYTVIPIECKQSRFTLPIQINTDPKNNVCYENKIHLFNCICMHRNVDVLLIRG